MDLSARPQSPERVGRFELLRPLGKGAQGTVYLARDTHLGREVALKTLVASKANPARVKRMLDEARTVSRLQHPHIVTLHDAGEECGAPYLVFEFVNGQSLAALLAERGPVAPARAADLMAQVLRGIAAAHAGGIVHRDLKPANIMITADGIARVMDFGIATSAQDTQHGERALYGTPAYMPPEYIDRREFTDRGDLFSAGLVLHEMLTGVPVVRGGTVFEILNRIAHEPIQPPSASASGLDEALDAIVMRALSKDPAKRYDSANAMEAALREWLAPRAAAGDSETGTLEFLLRRMRHKSDFPALSQTLGEVTRASSSEREQSSVLAGAILKDFALTNKMLRMVNTASFRHFGGAISTVSRALSIIGFDGVRGIAMSLVLIEHLQNRTQATALRDEVAAAYLSGVLAREIVDKLGIHDAEQAFICAMFHRLGKLLATFYLHDEAQAVERLATSRNIDENRAATEVLGISYTRLGMGVARHWGFPENLIASMPALDAGPVARATFENAPLQAVAELATVLSDAARETDPARRRKAITAIATRYASAGVNAAKLHACVEDAAKVVMADAPLLGFAAPKSPLMAAMRSCVGTALPEASAEAETDVLADTRLGDSVPTIVEGLAAPVDHAARQAVLAAGVQEITQALVSEFELNDVLRITLETMYRAIGFRRVLLCLRDPRGNALRARLGFGADAEQVLAKGFEIPLAGGKDVFHAALSQGADICIANRDEEPIRTHIPAWYRDKIEARGFVLFPILVAKKPIGLVYADADDPAALAFSPEELNLLKTLRNQAVLAIRQKG